MTEKNTSIALQPDALLSKSKLYIRRALIRKEANDKDEYQLWASLALELLGKAALSAIHPSLVADPTDQNSLFAASGIITSTDIKTISAKTIFIRLRKIVDGFDGPTAEFCDKLALRRNSELHSGDTPFRAMHLGAWEDRYWHASSLILSSLQLSLDDWLGVDQAEVPKEIVAHAISARKQSASVKIETARTNFFKLSSSERKKKLSEAEGKKYYNYTNLFSEVADHEWEHSCPACTAKAFLSGNKAYEEAVDSRYDEDGAWELMSISYMPEAFKCPTCGLSLSGSIELSVADLEDDHIEEGEREMQYEDEYGND